MTPCQLYIRSKTASDFDDRGQFENDASREELESIYTAEATVCAAQHFAMPKRCRRRQENNARANGKARRKRLEVKHDAGRSARLILRGSVQLRVEIIHLNQPELHKRNEFDVEARADRRCERGIGT